MSSPMFYAFASGACALVPSSAIRGERSVEVDGEIAHLNGDTVFYLAAESDANGRPTPGAQLETIREQKENGRELTVTETVGTGFYKRYGKWTLKRVIASRTFTHDKFAKREVRQAVMTAATWKKPNGEAANIWCRLVLESSAKLLGFKLPKIHLGIRRQQGNRAVGIENGAVRPAQQNLSARAESPNAVQQTTEIGHLPDISDVL